ncbi:hypothetical protein CTA1_3541 [Colletotrichum tanaceti]|uniref:Uncharacterized protein n=1 Tax=Colletotrichum tanaceti TaxID=1306861 RepID=A0A4U6XLR8_9PEZI|nr:hypothetical protein CTA1_3541 [Colletotrichum tanaceti]
MPFPRAIIDSLVDVGDPRFTNAADAFSGATTLGPAAKGIGIGIPPIRSSSTVTAGGRLQDDDRGSRKVDFPESESGRGSFLVEAPNKSDAWRDRGVLLLSNGDDLKPDPTRRRGVMTLDDVEISVRIAQFRIDVRDGMDDDYDILEMNEDDIDAQYEAQQKKMKSEGQGGVSN